MYKANFVSQWHEEIFFFDAQKEAPGVPEAPRLKKTNDSTT